MRERARDKGRLEDIIEYSNNVTQLIQGYSIGDFIADKRTYYAVMKNVEIIGEAAFMLTNDFKKTHSETPWVVVQGMRHVLVHDYANVMAETLYDTAINNIPELKQQVERYLADTNWAEWESTETLFAEIDDKINNAVATAQKMKNKGYPVEDIMEFTGLTEKEVREL